MDVYPGCASPQATRAGHVHFIDPVNGSMGGDGSRARPWHSLAEVVDAGLFATMPDHLDPTKKEKIRANPNAPIKPGDTVYLLTGDHGSVNIQGGNGDKLVGYDNSDFITIAALPGQQPVIRQLSLKGGSKWLFRGLIFRSTNATGLYATSYSGAYRDYWLVSLSGPHNDIVIADSRFESQPDVVGWTMHDWRAKRASGAVDSGGRCVSIVDSTFHNIGNGIGTQRSNEVLIARNVIDHFSDDAVDYGSDNLLMEGNRISNSVDDGDGVHRDGMQGMPYTRSTIVENVVIKDNSVIRLTDPNLAYPGALQGIDAFDGIWNNIVVTGNVVVTDAAQGIAFYGVHHATISNNILLGDDGKVLPCYLLRSATTDSECDSKTVMYDSSVRPGLHVLPSKDHVASSDVTVSDNIVSGLGVDPKTDAAKVVGNVCVLKEGKCGLALPIDGKVLWASKPGSYANNTITELDAGQIFATFDPAGMKYDLRIKSDPRSSSP